MASDNQSPKSYCYSSDGRLGLLFVIEILARENATKTLKSSQLWKLQLLLTNRFETGRPGLRFRHRSVKALFSSALSGKTLLNGWRELSLQANSVLCFFHWNYWEGSLIILDSRDVFLKCGCPPFYRNELEPLMPYRQPEGHQSTEKCLSCTWQKHLPANKTRPLFLSAEECCIES